MPEVSRFYGIVVAMRYNEHPPPHFHAEYGHDEIAVQIRTLAVMAGRLPPRAMGLVMEWAALHQAELEDNWTRAENLEPLAKIDPLP